MINPIHLNLSDFNLLRLPTEKRNGEALCPNCYSTVKLNGPGSDQGILNRFAMKFAWTISAEAQRLFTYPASVLHDMQGHMGLASAYENKLAAQTYRLNCYGSIQSKYSGIIDRLEAKKAEGFFTKIWAIRKINKAKRRWKELELVAEIHYSLLIQFGGDVMIHKACTDAK